MISLLCCVVVAVPWCRGVDAAVVVVVFVLSLVVVVLLRLQCCDVDLGRRDPRL